MTIKVRPYKQVITTTSPYKGKLRVYVKNDSSDQSCYEIQYSRNKTFTGYVYKKTITTETAKYRTYTASSGKNYYVRARSYYIAEDGTKIYGLYSTVKTIKVK